MFNSRVTSLALLILKLIVPARQPATTQHQLCLHEPGVVQTERFKGIRLLNTVGEGNINCSCFYGSNSIAGSGYITITVQAVRSERRLTSKTYTSNSLLFLGQFTFLLLDSLPPSSRRCNSNTFSAASPVWKSLNSFSFDFEIFACNLPRLNHRNMRIRISSSFVQISFKSTSQ